MNKEETVIARTEIQEGDILSEHGLLLRATKKAFDGVDDRGRVVRWECEVIEDNNPKDDPYHLGLLSVTQMVTMTAAVTQYRVTKKQR